MIVLLTLSEAPPHAAPGQDPAGAPDGSHILTEWRDAMRAGTRGGAGYVVVATTSDQDGIPGEIEERLTDRGYRRVVKRRFDDSEIVVSGHAAIRRDWNGWLREIKGQELRRIQASIFETRALVFGPPRPQESTKAEVSRSEDRSAYILRLTPPEGATVTFWLDATTLRPLKSVRPGEDGDIITTYVRWGEMGGVLTPLEGRVSETDKPEFGWKRSSLRLEDSAPDSAFAAPRPGPPDARLDPQAPPIPFDFDSSHIIFKASLNGRPPIGFLLDTGADENVIHSARLAAFGMSTYAKTTATGGGGSAEYGYARGATFTLPGVTVRDQHASVIDETGLERALGVPLGGLLGYDFISRFVVEIDYEKKLLTLHDPAGWSYSGSGSIVPITFDQGIPFTEGTISVGAKRHLPAYLVIDFGAAETMTLTSPFVKANDLMRLALTNARVNPPTVGQQFFSQSNVRGHVDRLTLGSLRAESIPVNLSVNTTGAYASPNFAGTVGQGIDRRYHVFLDYARSRVIFEPTAEATKPFPEKKTYGLTLLASGDDLRTYTVSAVRPGSPAEADGFRKDDVVTAFDDRPSADFTLGQLRDWLGRSGEHHRLEVSRGGASATIPVEIRLVSLDAS